MGEQDIDRELDSTRLRAFTQKLLTDLRALQHMIEEGHIESGVRRIGAEQEMFLVDADRAPALQAMEVLEDLDAEHFTTELGLFNLEANLQPLDIAPDCLSRMEANLNDLVAQAREAARAHGVEVLLVGILPTLEKSHLTLDAMTPKPRYKALNDAFHRLRGDHFEFHLKGPDELTFRHENVMVEACNTSFQVHFQVSDREFPRFYNLSQMMAAPCLAAAANSPLLFGRRLWRETRIALFQQSLDTRLPTQHVREQRPRVSFGHRWVEDSVLEIFQEDIARFRVLLGADIEEDPFEELREGGIPTLKALRLHNGTVYRWNRPCYGISAGRPHLRIENRVLPAGPTPLDEIANAAFWFGLIAGGDEHYGDVRKRMEFDDAKENFLSSARLGLQAQFSWPDRGIVGARTLILEELLPLARTGLEGLGIRAEDADRYLGVIEARVDSGRTGSQWLLDSFNRMKDTSRKAERLTALTAAMLQRQSTGAPVHEWDPARLSEGGGLGRHYSRVEQIMVTDLFTVAEDELVDLVACLMDWEHIRHVPVEDAQHRLVGLVSHRSLLRMMAQGKGTSPDNPVPVSEVMHRKLVTVSPETSTQDAIALMKEHRIGCLPVVRDDRLVGIVTERDFVAISGQLLEAELQRSDS